MGRTSVWRTRVRFDEPIEIVSTIAAIGESSLRIEHHVRTLNGTIVARGFEQRVSIAFADGKLGKAPIPADLRACLDVSAPTSKPSL